MTHFGASFSLHCNIAQGSCNVSYSSVSAPFLLLHFYFSCFSGEFFDENRKKYKFWSIPSMRTVYRNY